MILITGGKYQGKLAVAEEMVSVKFDACREKVEILDNCDQIVREQVQEGLPIDEILETWTDLARDHKIMIFNEVSMGVVPMDKNDRIFRETCGKVSTMLARSANEVYRVFCGVALRIK